MISKSYTTRLEDKKYAHNLVYGNLLHSFQLLLSYFYMFKRENPRTMTKLKIDDENRFEYLVLVFRVMSHVVDL